MQIIDERELIKFRIREYNSQKVIDMYTRKGAHFFVLDVYNLRIFHIETSDYRTLERLEYYGLKANFHWDYTTKIRGTKLYSKRCGFDYIPIESFGNDDFVDFNNVLLFDTLDEAIAKADIFKENEEVKKLLDKVNNNEFSYYDLYKELKKRYKHHWFRKDK
jgi:hypothetical protein